VNVSSIVYVSLSMEENILRTNHVCIVLIFSRTKYQEHGKGVGSVYRKENPCCCMELGTVISSE
jgi:hypothetical protein